MLTQDKTISTPAYWDSLYRGERNDTPVDSSNGIRPKASFDRFDIVVKHVEGPNVLGIGSGHAHIEKRIKALHPDWLVIASDQSDEARRASGYKSYFLVDAYSINVKDKSYNTLIATQCLEYMEHQDKALTEFKRVAKKFICTIPLNEMKKWSQLFIYNENDFCEWLSGYGTIEVKENYDELLLVKLKFNDN